MATSNLRTLKDAVIYLADVDGGAGDNLTLTGEDGNLSFTLPDIHSHIPDRGAPGNLIDAEFQPISFSFDLQIQAYTGSTAAPDIVTCTATGWDFSAMGTSPSGDFSGLSLSAGDTIQTSAVGVFQMRVTITDSGDASTETLYFINCRAESVFSEGYPNKLSVSGVSYMTVDAFMSNIS